VFDFVLSVPIYKGLCVLKTNHENTFGRMDLQESNKEFTKCSSLSARHISFLVYLSHCFNCRFYLASNDTGDGRVLWLLRHCKERSWPFEDILCGCHVRLRKLASLVRVAGHSAEIRTDYLPNTHVALPPNTAVEWLAPLIHIPIARAQISGRILTVFSKFSRFTHCIDADSGMLTPK
jgi:hypothetical protein